MKYIVQSSPVWHSAEQREYAVGSVIDLSHLSDGQRERLVGRGVVAPAPQGGEVEAQPSAPALALMVLPIPSES